MPKKNSSKFVIYTKKLLMWTAGPLILGAISIFVIEPMLERAKGPEKYKIYIVSDFTSDTSDSIKTHFEQSFKESLTIDGVSIETTVENDYGDPANAKNLAAEIAKKDDILMVVGHFYSTTTASALPAYMKADPQIPVILTTETNPNLVPPRARNGKVIQLDEYEPIFCLSPDDTNQAKIAAQHATREKEDKNFWVVQDVQNKVYSNYLAINFIEKVQKNANKKVLLLTDNTLIPSIGTIEKLKIDCIFYAGDWPNALILINQINAIYEDIPKPKIILSDGCVNNNLIEQGQDAVVDVFLTHQLKQEDFEKRGGWGLYGDEAAAIIEKIIFAARKRVKKSNLKKWFGFHRVGDSRKAIKEAMYEIFNQNGQKYRKQTDFQVWQVKKIKQGATFEYKFKDWEEEEQQLANAHQ